MRTYRIVAGVDGSAGARKALEWAVRQAASRSGTVQVIIAYRFDDLTVAEGGPQAQQAAALATLEHEIEAVPGFERAGVPIAAEAIEGRAADVLSIAAKDADLLVLGSHGHGRAWHTAVGSVSESCIRRAICPVVVIPARAE